MKRIGLALLLLAFSTHSVRAFNPPTDSTDGLTVTIADVPQTTDPGKPLPFTIVVTNERDQTLQGLIHTYLNDDWDTDPSFSAIPCPPGTTELKCTATARESVLEAHYPVHAACTFYTLEEEIPLHPIAIFQTAIPKSDQQKDASCGVPGGIYDCVKTSNPVKIDGRIEEWDKAQPLLAGSGLKSTGQVSSESFGAVVRMQHDDATLYLSAVVTDDDVSCDDKSTPDFMNSDYLRLYLGPEDPEVRNDAQLTEKDTVIAISVLGNGDAPKPRLVNYGMPVNRNISLDDCRFAAVKTSSGYALEVAIPLSAAGISAAKGQVIGANILLGDSDAGRRRGEVCLGQNVPNYWLTPQSYFRLRLSTVTESAENVAELPSLTQLDRKTYCLTTLFGAREGLELKGKKQVFPIGWKGTDKQTGASCRRGTHSRGGEERDCIAIHPPYRNDTAGGAIWKQYLLALPDVCPITFTCDLAIRNNREDEPPSDGVEFKVFAGPTDGDCTEMLSVFTDSKIWSPATVDLSDFAGKEILLTLWAGPGPKGNTTCDAGYWGNPEITVGKRTEPLTEQEWTQRTDRAINAAKNALVGKHEKTRFLLQHAAETFVAAVEPGERGMADTVVAFVSKNNSLALRGINIEVSGQKLGDDASDIGIAGPLSVQRWFGKLRLTQPIVIDDTPIAVQVTFEADEGSLKVAFSMPGTRRDCRGNPRFTKLSFGGATEPIFRTYLGFGNVIENPKTFSVRAGGFGLSTRHVGADYANGLSLLQATDIYPDRAVCTPDDNRFSLEAHHDATFTLVPSRHGAFAAARHYRDLSGFKPARGVDTLLGRMCLDQWGGDYGRAAEDLELAGKHGLNHSIFVKHAWQRWGYDYRLPEIYPPRGSMDDFLAMRTACKKYGILFAPHDNYIDFYPDAEGFSYDHIVFNRDGTPQRAWFNKGRKAQSYRWLPHAFLPWLKDNMKKMRDGFHPDGLFIDVFSAMPPIDYYDRSGRFYTKERTAKEWGRAFDVSRRILKRGAPMLSEAGHDGLIGSLDGVQSDHYTADRWGANGTAACRTPWHDMASHRSLVLLAGGLGHRYGNKDPKHTYGTDDYLSNTVIGGRNPMCDGPFSRRAVMTYWLLHDACNTLAHAELETHEFGQTVYQQHTTFSDGSQVWTNRGDDAWAAEGNVLPKYSFHISTPKGHAGIYDFGGIRGAYAVSQNAVFVDARPRCRSPRPPRVICKVLGGEYLGNGKFRVRVEWESLKELESGLVPFVHICHPENTSGENIAHHGSMTLEKDALMHPIKRIVDVMAEIPGTSYGGEYTLRFGLYNPERGGYRLVPEGNVSSSRVMGGKLCVDISDGKITGGKYIPEETDRDLPGVNVDGKLLDFGPIQTNGAFRLLTPEDDSMLLIPLPGSLPFTAILDLGKLADWKGTSGKVEAVDPETRAQEPTVSLTDGKLRLDLDGRSFAYRLILD